MAASLGIQVEFVEERTHTLLDVLLPTMAGKLALPVNEAIGQLAKTIWQTPSSVPLGGQKKEMQISGSIPVIRTLTRLPRSLVVAAFNKRCQQGGAKAPAEDRDAKKRNIFGRKMYSTASLQVCIASHSALLSR